MTPEEFQEMYRKARDIERVSKAIGIPEDMVAQFPFTLSEGETLGLPALVIEWEDGKAPWDIPTKDGATYAPLEFVFANRRKQYVRQLTVQQQEKLLKKFNELVPDDSCSVCGGEHGLAPHLTRVGYSEQKDLGLVMPIWVATSICQNCGYLRHFASTMYDLTDKNDEGR